MPAEDVPPSRLAAGSSGLDTADHVPDIDKVVRAGRGQQTFAAADLEEHAATGGFPVPRADHVDRVDDNGIETPIDLCQHGCLGRSLGDDVGALHHAAGRSLFIARHAICPKAEGIDAGNVHEAGPGPPGCSGQPGGALDVDLVHFVPVPPATVHDRSGVNHQPRAIDRLLEAVFVFQRADPLVEREPLKGAIDTVWARPDQDPDLPSGLKQPTNHIVADQTRAAGHETDAVTDGRRGGDDGIHGDQTRFLGIERVAAAKAGRLRTIASERHPVTLCFFPNV